MNKKIAVLLTIILTAFSLTYNINIKHALADDVNSVIQEEMDNLDFSNLEDFLKGIENGENVFSLLGKMINGDFDTNYNNLFKYVLNLFFSKISNFFPDFLILMAIILLYCTTQNTKTSKLKKETDVTINFVFIFAIILIIGKQIFKSLTSAKSVLENLSKLAEITSPIILTLSVACGGTAQSSVMQPAMIFASGSFTNIIYSVIFPLIILMTVLTAFNTLNGDVRFKGYIETVQSIIKWILGFLVVVFGIFSTVQGIAGRSFDGASIKIAKYLLSSSVPVVGGMVKDGLETFILGCSVIKNAIGITGVFAVFYMVLSPIFINVALSFLIKIASAYSETLEESGISKFLTGIINSLKYVNICIISSAFAFISCLLTMTLSLGGVM